MQEPARRRRGERRENEQNRDGQGKTRWTEGEGKWATDAETTATVVGQRRGSDNPPEQRKTAGAGGKYRAGGRKTEESADESAEWEGEDTEDSALEEEDATAMGEGGARMQMKATAGGSEENGADEKQGSAAADGGDTGDATSAAADEAGLGGRHGAIIAARERVAGRRENPSGDSYGVGGEGEGCEAYGVASKPSKVRGDIGGREAYIMAENPRGDCHGVGGGVELPQGINTPGVGALPQGDETPRV